MNHDEYMFFKNLGICTHCRHNKAEKGKTLCLVCKMENREYKSSQRWTKTKSEKAKREYLRRKQAGLCCNCGKYAQSYGILCKRCYATRKIRDMKKMSRSERIANGLCYTCGSSDLADGKKVCKRCYEIRLNSVKKIMYMNKTEKNAGGFNQKIC